MKNETELVTILAFVVTVIVGITVAYAALSTTLTVTSSKVTQNALTWNVGFTGTSATASVGGTSATGRTCGTATITSSTVTVADTTLSKPDDSCTYTLTVKNSGTISAKLSSITPTAPSSTTCGTANGGKLICGNISYTLASNTSGTTLATGGAINAGASQTMYLIIKYTGSSVNSSPVTQSGASFSLVYSQN